MKPYSKKYLTLALAGVLAASIPASAFATEVPAGTNTPAAEQPKDNKKPEAKEKENTQEENETEKAKEEARKAKEAEEAAKKKAQEEKEAREKAEKKLKELEEKEKEENRKKYGNITLSNVRYDGKYIKGETSAYAKIYVQDNYYNEFRNRKYIGEADRNGDFSIKYDIKEGKSVTIYAENKDYSSRSVEVKNDNYKDIKGTRIDASELSIFGRVLTGKVKGHAFDFITVYLEGEKLGTVRADKDGKFTLTLSKSINDSDLKDLRFYTDAKTVENKKFKVTEALEGQKIVKGTANTDDEITVYDANGKKISNTYVNNAGVFTAFLDRALINGETIKIEARDKDKNITKIEYKVTKNAVEEVKAIAYIKGYPDGTFKPQANVTRAEAAQMFATLLNGGTNFGTSQATKFSDASDDWYSKAINYVVGKGLISGYPNGTFKPNESITRAEFAQMISGYVKNEKASTSDFKDVKDHWAKDAIDKLYGNKNVNGYPDGSFKPNAKITRAEAVTILNSVFNRNTNKSSLNNVNTSSLNKFSDVNEGFWAYYNILDAANTHNRERLNSTSEVDMWK
ncbi:S-layer homology domain-containing protein [Peptoniphilus harei]|uniref:S-layer homology domain-containing protein n=1 Tax=Peptoniphilus harei TaxID=54005 RepID=UPI00254A955A|nr:S-layer homology domain-containing protein [Peptoniphilus harei]MDK7354225.1 S-layer homology domain-containing protein [Peptoniphilus harei]MDK7370147.1 S-layer homology domain-containing protein [Peptoniphilus harei]